MGFRVVRDGNAFYEIDEDCVRRKKKSGENHPKRSGIQETEAVRERKQNERKETV